MHPFCPVSTLTHQVPEHQQPAVSGTAAVFLDWYSQKDKRPEDQIRTYALGLSSIRDDVQQVCLAAKAMQEELVIHDLLQPIDHLATRLCG